jgi:hypothetical protein
MGSGLSRSSCFLLTDSFFSLIFHPHPANDDFWRHAAKVSPRASGPISAVLLPFSNSSIFSIFFKFKVKAKRESFQMIADFSP